MGYTKMIRDQFLKECNNGRTDFNKVDLRHLDFSYLNLYDIDLSESYLCFTNFRCAYLKGVNLRNANLFGADLSGADLRDTNLSGADLRNADLSSSTIKYFRCYLGMNEFTAIKGQIQIGCEIHSIGWWLENYKETGEKHGYSKQQIQEHGNMIQLVANFFASNKD